MPAFEVAEAPVPLPGQILGAAYAAQALAPVHPLEQNFKHRTCRLAQGDHENSLVMVQVDGFGPTAIGKEAPERAALDANTAIESRFDVGRLQSASENRCGSLMEKVERCFAGRYGHWSCSFNQVASACCIIGRQPLKK